MLNSLARHVDRRRLEAMMLSRVEAMPVQQVTDGVRMVERLPDGWRIELPIRHLTTRLIIDASGRSAVVARKFGEKRRLDRLVAGFATYDVPGFDLHHASLVDAALSGRWYTSPMPGGRFFVAFFSDADLLPRDLTRDAGIWTNLVDAAPDATRARIESLGVVPDEPSQGIASARTILPVRTSGNGWVAAGDAATAFDPLAWHGLTVAFWSGERAAAAAQAVLGVDVEPLNAYEASMADSVGLFSAGYTMCYGVERRFRDQPFWKRRTDIIKDLSLPDATTLVHANMTNGDVGVRYDGG